MNYNEGFEFLDKSKLKKDCVKKFYDYKPDLGKVEVHKGYGNKKTMDKY